MNLPSNKFARIISYLFIPPLMNFFIFVFLALHLQLEQRFLSAAILISFLFGLAIPVIYFVIMRSRGKIDDNDARVKEQRTNPYLFGILLTLAAILLSAIFVSNKIITIAWITYLVCSMILILVNKYWKISAHAMGAAIPLGIMLFYSNLLSLGLVVILILVGWSRIKLKMHNLSQVLAGGFLGIIIPALLFVLFR